MSSAYPSTLPPRPSRCLQVALPGEHPSLIQYSRHPSQRSPWLLAPLICLFSNQGGGVLIRCDVCPWSHCCPSPPRFPLRVWRWLISLPPGDKVKQLRKAKLVKVFLQKCYFCGTILSSGRRETFVAKSFVYSWKFSSGKLADMISHWSPRIWSSFFAAMVKEVRIIVPKH